MNNITSLLDHYGKSDLTEKINGSLKQCNLLHCWHINWSDLVPLDQFHVGGLEATVDLIKKLNLTPKSLVLDIGSGLGGPARYIAAKIGSKVTGIDLSPHFTEAATMLTKKVNLNKLVKFQCGDALMLPFNDNSFDSVYTQHVAMNIQDREKFYSEINRVLKPNGLLGIYDAVSVDDQSLVFPVPWATTSDISFLLNEDKMHDILNRHGFDEVSWIDKTSEGIEWFNQQEIKKALPQEKPKINLSVIMGEDFSQMSSNYRLNLIEGRVKLLQAILKKRS